MRREGDSVTIRANDVEGEDYEFSHWMINGQMIGDREYTFTVGTEEVMIYAVARAKVDELVLKLGSSIICKAVYSTDYETGERYISTISINEGNITDNTSPANIFQGLTVIRRGANGESPYQDIFTQCEFDFGGAIEKDTGKPYMFEKPGRYTVTITDKANPELSISFTLQVVGQDPTGTYVWVSRTGEKYHVDPGCSSMQTVTAMTVEEAEAAGYEPCKICAGEN
jgi:hypothetical protein